METIKIIRVVYNKVMNGRIPIYEAFKKYQNVSILTTQAMWRL